MRSRVGRCRRTTASLLAAAIACILLVAAAPASAADCGPYVDSQPGQATHQQIADATLCLLNVQRANYGLQPLKPFAPLADTANKYASYMVSDEHFAHQDEDGHDVVWRVLQTDPSLADRWDVFGENLGWGTYTMATPNAMVTGWMNSPSHRENILYGRFDLIGVGVADGAPEPGKSGALTYTTVFAKLNPPAKPAKKVAKPKACSRKKIRRAKTRAARLRAKRACAARAAHASRLG